MDVQFSLIPSPTPGVTSYAAQWLLNDADVGSPVPVTPAAPILFSQSGTGHTPAVGDKIGIKVTATSPFGTSQPYVPTPVVLQGAPEPPGGVLTQV